MDVEKLDQEVLDILSRKDSSSSYADIREELIEKGYNQEELRYILGLVDEQLLDNLDNGGQNRAAKRNMVLGGVLSFIGLLVIGASYFGQQAPREVYYVSLVVFAVGYLVFRNGFRRRNSGNK